MAFLAPANVIQRSADALKVCYELCMAGSPLLIDPTPQIADEITRLAKEIQIWLLGIRAPPSKLRCNFNFNLSTIKFTRLAT
ncbi:hypothetical protein PENANT_c008G06220 [Penicillium antarcticum]|uniref:Uncharacterized protein n=1 Tax=Penicillium antarcticum TaxID=416450 RepID=A0A1V6QAE3_9EURO|nr:hypothetical protein PENANT_c008G06220 [Penicillium antarcticum]